MSAAATLTAEQLDDLTQSAACLNLPGWRPSGVRSGITFTDIFCGFGGSSVGLEHAGLELKLAANHWARAIEVHSANFLDDEHLIADVSNYDCGS